MPHSRAADLAAAVDPTSEIGRAAVSSRAASAASTVARELAAGSRITIGVARNSSRLTERRRAHG